MASILSRDGFIPKVFFMALGYGLYASSRMAVYTSSTITLGRWVFSASFM